MASNLEPVPITSQKHDPAWKHCQMFKNGDRVQLKCIYCLKMFKGGGIHRIKEHLACQKGNASTCSHVPHDVRLQMQHSLDGVVVKKRKKQKIEEVLNVTPIATDVSSMPNQVDVNAGIQCLPVQNPVEHNSALIVNPDEGMSRTLDRRKRGRGKTATLMYANSEVANMDQNALFPKKVENHIHMAIGRFLYDIGAPLDAVNSVYFQQMIEAIASGGSGVEQPSYHDLRGWILKDAVREVKSDIERSKMTWARTGCSILVDQWSTETDFLYELIKQVVEEVGVANVLQLITSGEEQYAVAGRRLTDIFPTVYWSPSAAYCIDLILEDFGNIEWISAVIEQARSITRFVYNYSAVLNMVRRYTLGNDIVDPSFSRFATNFTTLKRMVDLKHNLQAMVTSQEWMDCPYSKHTAGLEMLDCMSNETFWSSSELIVRLTVPLLRVLRITTSEKRPAMGYVYAGIYRAKEAIKKELVKREDYMVYWNIIHHRWERLWHHPLHAAGFYLNPKFFYSVQGDMHSEILSGMFDCIERLVPDTRVQDKIIKEINSYKTAAGDFGRKMAVRARDNLLPSEWWSTYGGGCPNLARLAIHILSQTCSVVVSKKSPIPFEQIVNTRNHIERQHLTDLVFVHYNLRLRQKSMNKEQEFCDPLSFEGISNADDWIRAKDLHLEEYGNSDWMALDPFSVNTMLLKPLNDETEELCEGFDDFEIFSHGKDGEIENTGDKFVNQ
ncbi:DNA binding protein [Senna tora]|uniref:DNA binding protein n=1 Tax=Senna tora TaxID=362788 RepID=A0A834WEJ1_9FABA|nr:DNA binding protein [Senna tora]